MNKYRINISIKEDDLSAIQRANEKIILVKQAASASNTLAWVSFNPFQHNTESWDNSFSVYASNDEMKCKSAVIRHPDNRSVSCCSSNSNELNPAFVNLSLKTENGKELLNNIKVPREVLENATQYSITSDENGDYHLSIL